MRNRNTLFILEGPSQVEQLKRLNHIAIQQMNIFAQTGTTGTIGEKQLIMYN